ncbi:MAG: class I SAM-dependent methyltransferase [bacterium]|nr:class I SAM-dependent methyltransferase [bacterium]
MQQTKTPWNTFAKLDPRFFISTGFGKNEDGFWKSGEKTAELLIERVKPFLHDYKMALDFGAGIGRIAIPMSHSFKELRAVDVSPKMLELLNDNCSHFEVSNIIPYLDDQTWDDVSVDFAFSVLTFQHMPDWSDIERYVARIAKCLRGVAYFQFDTRPLDFWYTIKAQLPNAFVPAVWKKGMRRIRRQPKEVRALFTECGLKVLKEFDQDSPLHGFLLTR